MVKQEKKLLWYIILGLSLFMALYHMVYTQIILQESILHVNTHLGLSLVLLFLFAAYDNKEKKLNHLYLSLAVLSLIAVGYVQIFAEGLKMRQWFNTGFDLAAGLLLIILALIAAKKSFGLFIPLITIIIIAYPFIGSHLPEPLNCTSYSFWRTISNLSVSLMGGIYDMPLTISARYLFLIVLFGGILNAVGATRFILLASRLFVGKIRSGTALVAVLSSAGIGSVVGSGVANIAITGSFTIPLMKKVGYRPEDAAAIESAASMGGQLLPPMMGMVAFAIVGYTGIPYLTVCKMALLPALLYFLAVGLFVVLQSKRSDIKPVPQEKVDRKELLQTSFLFFIPLIVIVVLLVKGYSVMFSIFWAIVSALIVSFFTTRPSLNQLKDGLIEGVRNGVSIGAMTACVGLIQKTLTMSGLGVKLSLGMEAWSGGNLFIALLIITFVCILLGMAGSILLSYILVAIFAIPAVMSMGVPMEHAHFFALWPINFTPLTPPVAIGVLVAARMASANYLRACLEALKAGGMGLIIPFMFIYSPILLLREPITLAGIVTGILPTVLIIIAGSVAGVGYCINKCNWLERALFMGSALSLFISTIMQINTFLYVGFGLFFAVLLYHLIKSFHQNRSVSGECSL